MQAASELSRPTCWLARQLAVRIIVYELNLKSILPNRLSRINLPKWQDLVISTKSSGNPSGGAGLGPLSSRSPPGGSGIRLGD